MVSPRHAAVDLLAAAEDGRLEVVCRDHGIALLVLFGSAAEDGDHEPADLDIAVLPRRPETFDRIRGHTALVDLLRTDRIDLLDLSSAGWLARSQALGSGIPLYEDEPGVYTSEQLRSVPLAMELGWLVDLDLALQTGDTASHRPTWSGPCSATPLAIWPTPSTKRSRRV